MEIFLAVLITAITTSVVTEVVRKFSARHDVDSYVLKTDFDRQFAEFGKQCLERRSSCGSITQLKAMQDALSDIREDIRELRNLLLKNVGSGS